jgi:hypothetical protein
LIAINAKLNTVKIVGIFLKKIINVNYARKYAVMIVQIKMVTKNALFVKKNYAQNALQNV